MLGISFLQQSNRVTKEGASLFPIHSNMDGHNADDSKQSTTDMAAFEQYLLDQMEQNLLQQMHRRLQTMSDLVITKIDDMGGRIEELEQSINELRAEMGVENSPSPSVTVREKSLLSELKSKKASLQNLLQLMEQNLLQQMHRRLQTMSDSIITKIDVMGGMIEEFEQNINELWAKMGVENTPSPSVTVREESPLSELKPEKVSQQNLLQLMEQNLLQQMRSRFQTMSDLVITKMDDMGGKIEKLEQNINELRAEIG